MPVAYKKLRENFAKEANILEVRPQKSKYTIQYK